MKGDNRVLLFLLTAGMELCYLYAWTNFGTTLFFRQTFPFPEAVGSFLLAALLTLFADGRGWRVIFVLGVQSLGFIPAFLRMVDVFRSWSPSFSSNSWFSDFFASSTDAIEYFIFILAIVWILVFWAGGVGHARRQRDYATLCARFDRGLIAFFVLFLTKFYLQAIQGMQSVESISGLMLFPFLIFSLLGIGLVRNQGAGQRDFIPGFQKIGVLLGFSVVILLGGAGTVFFFLPYLTLAAEKGNDVLSLVSGPLVSIVFAITTWLFGTDFTIKNAPAAPTPVPNSSAQVNLPAWLELLGRILAWGVGLLVVLVLLAMLGGMLYGVFRWLFSKTALEQEKASPRRLLSSIFDPVRALLLFCWRGIILNLMGKTRAVQLYTGLRTWGHLNGSPHLPDETPTEYGLRLKRRFPMLEKEMESIIQAYNREVYGEIVLDEQQLAAARSAWRRLVSPIDWLVRLKSSLLRPLSSDLRS